MTSRLDRVGAAVADAMRILLAAGEPGFSSTGELAAGLAIIFRARLGPCERLTVAIAGVLSLDRDTAEELAEAVLHDLRAGPPIPPFMSIRDETQSWALFASRGEHCHYLAAAWGQLSQDDRQRFLRRAI